MFLSNEKVVYPGHGVAHINRIIEKKIAGNAVFFFELTFLSKDMIILVPVDNADSVGIRPLSSPECIAGIFALLATPVVPSLSNDMSMSNWNKRNKDYQIKLRRGNLSEISVIYRDIKYIGLHKELSFGEKMLLGQTEALLVEEISLIKNMPTHETLDYLRSLIPTMVSKGLELRQNL
ncbi:MAG: hypothetical protein NT124_00430 [Candidatus Dependentiae bacterium]|nr:hypothetical protein [Candidatus Dependentiae bacterium]